MEDSKSLKENYNEELIKTLGEKVKAVYSAFDLPKFKENTTPRFKTLELKERIGLITEQLQELLPPSYPEAIGLLLQIMGEAKEDEQSDDLDIDFNESGVWMLWPIAQFVETFGVDYFDESIDAIYEITKRFSGEFAIRPFLRKHPKRTLSVLRKWSKDKNYHVRRLVSEGCRPRLPWASHLKPFIKDPAPVLKLLEKLKDDTSLYVRRSVANNLNDIIKDNQKEALAVISQWSKDAPEERQWIIRHALRNLVKAGDPDALEILGYSRNPKVKLQNLHLTPKTLKLGGKLNFSFVLENTLAKAQPLVVDYVIHFQRANGRKSPKVFKLKNLKLEGKEKNSVQKDHAIKPISTRKYYPGEHRLEIQVNGKTLGGIDFELIKK